VEICGSFLSFSMEIHCYPAYNLKLIVVHYNCDIFWWNVLELDSAVLSYDKQHTVITMVFIADILRNGGEEDGNVRVSVRKT